MLEGGEDSGLALALKRCAALSAGEATRGRAPEPAGLEEEQQLGQHGLIDRTEYLRLIQQALASMGYAEVRSIGRDDCRLDTSSARCLAPAISKGRRPVVQCCLCTLRGLVAGLRRCAAVTLLP
jgi:hypothetical protein